MLALSERSSQGRPTFAARIALTFSILALPVFTSPATAAEGAGDEVVASWKGGSLTLAELQYAAAGSGLPICRRARQVSLPPVRIHCYRRLAESLVLERLVVGEIENVEAAIRELDGYERMRRRAYLDHYLEQRREEIVIAASEIDARLDAEKSDRPSHSVRLANIFVRHQDPNRAEATVAHLRTVKARFDAGEPFEMLARELSHSETRLRGGEIGQVDANELPPTLSEAVLALGEGEVSEPIPVRGGAVLLRVLAIVESAAPSVTLVRAKIERDLVARRERELISERVARHEPPSEALILDLEVLISTLDGGNPDLVVLEVAGDRLTAGELRALQELGTGNASELGAGARARLAETYRHERDRRLLSLVLVETADAELRAAAEGALRRDAIGQLVDEHLASRGITAEEADLRAWFKEDQDRFEIPERFEIRRWRLPFAADPPSQLARMELVREQLLAGNLDLSVAAAELGGQVDELGWRDVDDLVGELGDKVRQYLAKLGDARFTIPFRHREAFHVLEILAHESARSPVFSDITERIRSEYPERELRELRVAERLEAAGYHFDADAVRELLEAEPD